MSEEKLADFLQNGKDWSRVRTSVPGVFVLKLPAYRGSPTRLAVELNPVGEDVEYSLVKPSPVTLEN